MIAVFSLPVWFIALMAVIAGRSWSVAFILIGLVMIVVAVALLASVTVRVKVVEPEYFGVALSPAVRVTE